MQRSLAWIALLGACASPPPPPSPAPVATASVAPVTSASSASVEPEPEPAPAQPTSLDEATSPSYRAASPAGTGGDFDRGNAAAALSEVDVRRCGMAGSGKIDVLFQPNGNVTNVHIADGTFDSRTTACIVEKYRAVHVRPFTGAPVRVKKAFTVK